MTDFWGGKYGCKTIPASRCPHCGRPFVDMRLMRAHVANCVEERQKQLDESWQEGGVA